MPNCLCSLPDAQQLTGRRVVGTLIARDAPTATQIAYEALREAQAICSGALLSVEDAGDHGIVVMQRPDGVRSSDGVFIGTHGWQAVSAAG